MERTHTCHSFSTGERRNGQRQEHSGSEWLYGPVTHPEEGHTHTINPSLSYGVLYIQYYIFSPLFYILLYLYKCVYNEEYSWVCLYTLTAWLTVCVLPYWCAVSYSECVFPQPHANAPAHHTCPAVSPWQLTVTPPSSLWPARRAPGRRQRGPERKPETLYNLLLANQLSCLTDFTV